MKENRYKYQSQYYYTKNNNKRTVQPEQIKSHTANNWHMQKIYAETDFIQMIKNTQIKDASFFQTNTLQYIKY